jgi:hypothetical protein
VALVMSGGAIDFSHGQSRRPDPAECSADPRVDGDWRGAVRSDGTVGIDARRVGQFRSSGVPATLASCRERSHESSSSSARPCSVRQLHRYELLSRSHRMQRHGAPVGSRRTARDKNDRRIGIHGIRPAADHPGSRAGNTPSQGVALRRGPRRSESRAVRGDSRRRIGADHQYHLIVTGNSAATIASGFIDVVHTGEVLRARTSPCIQQATLPRVHDPDCSCRDAGRRISGVRATRSSCTD